MEGQDMKERNLFEYFMAEWGMMLGAICLGFCLPFGTSIMGRALDFLVFSSAGIILLGVSYYYKFIKKW